MRVPTRRASSSALKHGIVPPSALNNGEQVDLLVGRIAAPYYAARTFDELPTPFRAVAVDLLTATPVVLDRGPLDWAMRATMSLPLIFPPVQLDGHVLVDGGAMDNVPADMVKAMGATRDCRQCRRPQRSEEGRTTRRSVRSATRSTR